ncbi:DUF3489 domain-containing protein [Sphingobium xenophagum]|uniref:DUF3489 domain-containing protein n=1 Tax=Sphingobium xenophagum TaxID=121428 RepID=UPI0003781A96|nr:DUF3489 domain-containing protein [Sphingobium xenophagum]
MPKLSDTQAILLIHAAQRESSSLYPLPASMAGKPLTKPIAALLRQGLLEERKTREKTAIHRSDDELTYGLFITKAGLAAVNIGSDVDEPELTRNEAPPPLPRQNKSDLVCSLLARADGATLAELVDATGWLPHSTRAALTGLRKKGVAIARFSRDGATCYRSDVSA